MADVATTLVLRMQDDASAQMTDFGQSTQAATIESLQLNTALTAMGSALTAVGSLINQIDAPAAKMAATFVMTAGAIMSTVAAIGTALPYIRQLITWLRNLSVVQAVVAALSGPVGWGRLAIGLGIAGAATAGIVAMTGGFSRGTTTEVNINAQAFAGNEAEARKFGARINRFGTEETTIGR